MSLRVWTGFCVGACVCLPVDWTHRKRFTLSLFVQCVRTLLSSVGGPLNDGPVSRLRRHRCVRCQTGNTILTKQLPSFACFPSAKLNWSECFQRGTGSKKTMSKLVDKYSNYQGNSWTHNRPHEWTLSDCICLANSSFTKHSKRKVRLHVDPQLSFYTNICTLSLIGSSCLLICNYLKGGSFIWNWIQ